MGIQECSGLMKPVDENGNPTIFYPLTLAQNVRYNNRTVEGALEELETISMKTFGVQWDYRNPSTELTRLTRATDPNHFVTVDITKEPVPAVGTGTGSSPFDNYLPWAGMEEYNIENGVVTCARGDSNFSRTDKDTMVYIPKFYYAVFHDKANHKMYYYISDQPRTSFMRHPGSDRYVARYNTGGGYVSRSGILPLGGITRDASRKGSAKKGAKWCQYDYVTWCAVGLLYLLEFANWDSQVAVGAGNVSSGIKKNTGGTDAMIYHTGRAYNDENIEGEGWGYAQIQYRHIEDLMGNCYEWVDGVNFYDRQLYVCLDHTKFADDTKAYYTPTGMFVATENGFISKLGFSEKFPYAFVPTEGKGDNMSYIPDRTISGPSYRVFEASSPFESKKSGGLFNFTANNTSGVYSSGSCARLLFIPNQE